VLAAKFASIPGTEAVFSAFSAVGGFNHYDTGHIIGPLGNDHFAITAGLTLAPAAPSLRERTVPV
jgi:hypothetical protein